MVKLLIFLVAFLGFGFVASAQPQQDTVISKIETSFNQFTKEAVITDTLCAECQQKDTITPMGVKIQYKYKNGVFKIICSDKSFTRELDSSYICNKNQNGVWDFVPKFEYETKNYLVFNNVLSTFDKSHPPSSIECLKASPYFTMFASIISRSKSLPSRVLSPTPANTDKPE